jgi:ABC-type bacteriocin/lantibiotic exporter with double-glycine peptidase domain
MLGLGTWFLVSLLGTAAWVGLAVMIALLPIPAWTSNIMAGVQKKKMEATDARVKAVKETLNVLRMVKQFGWEEEVKKQIEAQRAEELKWIFWRKMYNLVNIIVK